MFKGQTYAELYQTPLDEVDAKGDPFPLVENRIIMCYDADKGPIVQSDYGINLVSVMDAMGRAVDRGIYLTGVCDATQFASPFEHKAWQAWWLAHPGPWQNHQLVAGTSTAGAAFIAHSKKRVYNACINGYDMPDRPFGYYTTLEDALTDGYPVVEFGSLNITNHAGEQENDVCLIPSKAIAAMFVASILADRDWIIKHEALRQPFPVAA